MVPDWPAPHGVLSWVSTVQDGNLALHAGDTHNVLGHRQRLLQVSGLPGPPLWLDQVHGNRVVVAETCNEVLPKADAVYSAEAASTLAIMVADCLPVLLAARSGLEIAAVHAGWRGLCAGVIPAAVRQFKSREVIAYLGPAIGACHYEVDGVVRHAFDSATGFRQGRDKEHWMMDLAEIASMQLMAAGVKDVFPSGICTFCDERFYSHRRDPKGGRFAALISR